MTSWQFTTRAEDAWKLMLMDCAKAQKSIDIEQFIFQDDAVGRRFIEVILQKAKVGVKVRLLLDAARCYAFSNSQSAIDLKRVGVYIQFFNPINPWRVKHLSWWPFRDHRKLLIVDSEIVHIGGVGINAEFWGWRDTNVRIIGPIVKDTELVFNRAWKNAIHDKFHRFKKPGASVEEFQILTNAPHIRQRFIYRALVSAIRRAKQTVYLTTPYFVPDIRLFRAIRHASRRGVDVRIILPERSDHRYIDVAAGSYFSLAMKKGVRFFKYRHGIIHSKTAIVDSSWSTVGSMNLDSQGLFWCHEGNIVSTNADFARELSEHFFVDLKNSIELQRREWEVRSTGQKLLELATWPLHKFF